MPRQNRVNPFGELIVTPARGTRMGNRGCLHDANGQIKKVSARKAWVTCLLDFKGYRRQVMAPGRYTELFFLDEATALAAGHRPCGTCQKSRYAIFKQLWIRANASLLEGKGASIQDIDTHLHTERYASSGDAAFQVKLVGDLPEGTFVLRESDPSQPYLLWESQLHPWSPDGYAAGFGVRPDELLRVITPRSIVNTLAGGYYPQVYSTIRHGSHKSIESGSVQENTESGHNNSGTVPSSATEQKFESKLPDSIQLPEGKIYKLSKTPSGKELFTYFAAVLRITGMDQGVVYPLKNFFRNFSGHINAGRIERVDEGYKLTPSGIDYFADRYRQGSRQHVDESEVQNVIQQMMKGGDDWVPVD